MRHVHRPTRGRGRRTVLASALASTLLLILPATGSALPTEEPDPVPAAETTSLASTTSGFSWHSAERFGDDADADGIIDYHWDALNATYDQAYVNPDGFDLGFDGCSSGHSGALSWAVDGAVIPDADSCVWTHRFPAEGDYEVTLTVTPDEGEPVSFTETVTVKDWFIVSIGDSYGSGEGSPDVTQRFDVLGFVSEDARWVDRRCHRSANAGSAQAAVDIERSDPQSSVTFISLACSGATIDREVGEGAAHRGSGVLNGYVGTEAPSPRSYLKSQVQALAEAADGRTIDALIISGGGNDIHFADIIADCVWHNIPRFITPWGPTAGRCHEQPAIQDRLADDLAELPNRYDRLAAALADPAPVGRPALDIDRVYLTEYPDPTTDDAGNTCSSMLGEILPTTPFDFAKIHIDMDEAEWAREEVIRPLNAAVRAAAERHADKGWEAVTGISERFHKHGYCAEDRYMVQAYESAIQQGPLWDTSIYHRGALTPQELMAQTGTMHPNRKGYAAYAAQIRGAVVGTQGSGPRFDVATTGQGVTSRVGSGGWLTGVCDGSGCTSDRAVITVSISDPAGLRAATLTVGGRECANVAGMTCTPVYGADGLLRWTIEVTTEGVHQLTFVALNQDGVNSTFHHDLKLDLSDPLPPTAEVVDGTVGNNGWYRSAVDVRFDASDTPTGSGVALIEYSTPLLDDGAQYSVAPKGTTSFGQDKIVPTEGWQLPDGTVLEPGAVIPAAEGEYEITYRAVDQAGRRSKPQTLTLKIDKTAPTIVLDAPHEADYLLREVVPASFECTDETSGVETCVGTVDSGASIDTSAVGTSDFAVSAEDVAGNASTRTLAYDVTYGITALYDESAAKKAGSTVPIKLQLTDAHGVNVSDPAVVLTAKRLSKLDSTVGPVNDVASNANPDSGFRYAGDGYIYNYSTKGLSTGNWALAFTATGDPVEHAALFGVR